MKMSKRDKTGASSFYAQIKDYRRILRSGGSLTGNTTIYGSDKNLAIVSMDGLSESVKYIELKNIRAVLIRRLPLAPKAAVLGLLLLVVLGVIYASSDGYMPLVITFAIVFALLFLFLLIGIKNCTLRIVTDVSDHFISSVHRYRVAKKLLDFVSEQMQPYLAQDIKPAQPVEETQELEESESIDQPDSEPEDRSLSEEEPL